MNWARLSTTRLASAYLVLGVLNQRGASNSLDRRLAAMMSTDIEGYTRMTQANDPPHWKCSKSTEACCAQLSQPMEVPR